MKMRNAALVAAMIGLGLPGVAAATDQMDSRRATAFSWMANGAQDVSEDTRRQRAKAAVIRAKALNSNATWVCSPAGFGKKSRCHRG